MLYFWSSLWSTESDYDTASIALGKEYRYCRISNHPLLVTTSIDPTIYLRRGNLRMEASILSPLVVIPHPDETGMLAGGSNICNSSIRLVSHI